MGRERLVQVEGVTPFYKQRCPLPLVCPLPPNSAWTTFTLHTIRRNADDMSWVGKGMSNCMSSIFSQVAFYRDIKNGYSRLHVIVEEQAPEHLTVRQRESLGSKQIERIIRPVIAMEFCPPEDRFVQIRGHHNSPIFVGNAWSHPYSLQLQTAISVVKEMYSKGGA